MHGFTQWAFLDFDGVTHPYFPRAELTDAQNQHFSFLPAIEAVFRRHPNTGIVISSSWREKHSLEALQAKFSADVRDRVVGFTPVLESPGQRGEDGSRQTEVEAWLAANGQSDAPWVAVDDTPFLFFPGAAVVVIPDFFGDAEAERLDEALRDPKAYAHTWPLKGAGRGPKPRLVSTPQGMLPSSKPSR
jgi:hypothetical protein